MRLHTRGMATKVSIAYYEISICGKSGLKYEVLMVTV